MPRDDATPAGPLTALQQHWLVTVVLVVLGAAAGVGVAVVTPTIYTAEARVAVGSTDLSALSIPGYALGSQQLAADVARYVGQSGAQAAVTSALGGAASSVTDITASPVTESNIVRVEASAEQPATARAAADAAAQYLVTQGATVNGGSTVTTLLTAYSALARDVAVQGQARDGAKAVLDALPAGAAATAVDAEAYVAASAKYDTLVVQQTAAATAYQAAASAQTQTYKLVVVAPAADSTNTALSSRERSGLVGVVAGFLLALVVTSGLARRRPSTGPNRHHHDRVEDHEHVGVLDPVGGR